MLKHILDNRLIYFLVIWFIQTVMFSAVFSLYYQLPTQITGITDIRVAEREQYYPLISFLKDERNQNPDETAAQFETRMSDRFLSEFIILPDQTPLPDDVQEQLRDYAIAYDPEEAILYASAPHHQIFQIGPIQVSSVRATGFFNLHALMTLAGFISTLGIYFLRSRQMAEMKIVDDILETIGRDNLQARIPKLRTFPFRNMAVTINRLVSRLEAMIARSNSTLNGMAHEFLTPLSRITLQAQVLRTAKDDKKQAMLDSLQTNISHLSTLAAMTIKYAKLDQAQIPIHPVDVNISDWVDDNIKIELDDIKPPIKVERLIKANTGYFDPDTMGLVLRNLLNNAAKYGHGQICITVDIVDHALLLEVADNGKGIAESDKAKIFLPFVRLSSTETQKGFGIGLSFVHSIIELHGGEISVLDNDMGGTTFRVKLPL